MGYQATATHTGHDYGTQVSPVQDNSPARYTRKPEPVKVVLACCSNEEYARRTAKPDEVRGYYVPGYLAA